MHSLGDGIVNDRVRQTDFQHPQGRDLLGGDQDFEGRGFADQAREALSCPPNQ